VAHLNNCGSALPPAVVVDTMVDYLHREAEIGGYEAAAEAAERVAVVRASVGALVGADPDNVALVESATEAWNRALAAVLHTEPLRSGDRVLLSAAEYASNALPLIQLARRDGVCVEFIPDGPDGALDVAALREMLDERVRVVAITHVPSQNGLVNDVAGAGRALRQSGIPAWYLVDACQSVGQMPLDQAEIGCHFLSATGRKFLRGPRGSGFLAASDAALHRLEPFPVDLWSATWTSDQSFTVQPDARRFERFERSYATTLGLGAAADYALTCGLDAIRDRIRLLATAARDGLAAVDGVVVRDRGTEQSGIVTFTVDGVAPVDVVAAARAAGINVSESGPTSARHDFETTGLTGVTRVSPHAYNTRAEIDRLVHVVSTLRPGASPVR
jgi:selenocysteine lyase/cysteine desulfurase